MANSKPWIDYETISVICRRDKRFKKYKKSDTYKENEV